MPQALFVHGDPLMIDYTPSAAVASGDVLLIGDQVRIAHLDIPANRLGALAVEGGVYEVAKEGVAIADGKKVYWDDANKRVTETAGTSKAFGLTVKGTIATETTTLVQHRANS